MARDGDITRILFVCTGNICRSPSAEAVLQRLADEAGMAGRIELDSAGLGPWHVGHPPDERAIAAAERRGYSMDGQIARQVQRSDFERFDLVIAMDRGHHRQLARLCPPEQGHRLRLFMEFSQKNRQADVPDPYYGDDSGFETMLDLIEEGAQGLLAELRDGAATSD